MSTIMLLPRTGVRKSILATPTEPAMAPMLDGPPAATLNLHHVAPEALVALRELAAVHPAITIVIEGDRLAVELRGERAEVLLAAAQILTVIR